MTWLITGAIALLMLVGAFRLLVRSATKAERVKKTYAYDHHASTFVHLNGWANLGVVEYEVYAHEGQWVLHREDDIRMLRREELHVVDIVPLQQFLATEYDNVLKGALELADDKYVDYEYMVTLEVQGTICYGLTNDVGLRVFELWMKREEQR